MWKQASRTSRLPSLTSKAKRSIHTVPKLGHDDQLRQKGINGLYSAKGFNTAWTDYQTYLMKRLTQLTIETENETRAPFHILQNAARKSDQANVFNIASQAYNNHLFIGALTEPATNQSKPSLALLKKIEKTWGGIDQLREEIFSRAEGLLGSGWVFLVEDGDKSLYTLACYNAGTPFVTSRAQMFDLNGVQDPETNRALEEIAQEANHKEKNHVIPLLAVNLWEHAYIPDYSVAGRSAYVEKWWDSIDWNVVNSRYFPAQMS